MNQDAYKIVVADESEWPEVGHRFIVADGMGAHAAGELASQLAVDEVAKPFPADEASPRSLLNALLQSANSVIHQRGQEDTKLYNMGTTCSALLLRPEGALVAHVGDSRVYRCRAGKVQQLTFDHSLVWEMRAAGQVTNDSAAIPRNVITRCLGPHADVEVDIEGYFSVQPGDTFLLCSDGLTGRIQDEELGAAMRDLEPGDAVNFLVDLANLRGGSDNITVLVVRSDSLAATGEVSDSPVTVSSESHPGWWLTAGAGLVLALGSYQLAQEPYAFAGVLAGLGIFCVSAIGAAWPWLNRGVGRSPNPNTLASPYATASCELTDELVDGFYDTFNSICVLLKEQTNTNLGDLSALIDQLRNTDLSVDASSVLPRAKEIARKLREMI